MKSFTMFGSHVCPDTIAAMCILDQKGFSYTYKDITGTMIFLKEFLHLRDSREAFQAVFPVSFLKTGALRFLWMRPLRGAGRQNDHPYFAKRNKTLLMSFLSGQNTPSVGFLSAFF